MTRAALLALPLLLAACVGSGPAPVTCAQVGGCNPPPVVFIDGVGFLFRFWH